MTRQVTPYIAVLSTVAATTWYHTCGLLLQSGNIACKFLWEWLAWSNISAWLVFLWSTGLDEHHHAKCV